MRLHNRKILSTGEYYGFEPYRMVDEKERDTIQSGIAFAKEVIEQEQPIRFDVLCHRLSSLFKLGEKKLTDSLRRKTSQLISHVKPRIKRSKGFVYLIDFKEIQVRYRTRDVYHKRNSEDICHEEVMQALSIIGNKHHEIAKEKLIKIAVNALGYSRSGCKIRMQVR